MDISTALLLLIPVILLLPFASGDAGLVLGQIWKIRKETGAPFKLIIKSILKK